jgi:hypothetical protein
MQITKDKAVARRALEGQTRKGEKEGREGYI